MSIVNLKKCFLRVASNKNNDPNWIHVHQSKKRLLMSRHCKYRNNVFELKLITKS